MITSLWSPGGRPGALVVSKEWPGPLSVHCSTLILRFRPRATTFELAISDLRKCLNEAPARPGNGGWVTLTTTRMSLRW